MTIHNIRHLRRSRCPRSLSWYSEDSDEGHPRSLEDEIDDISSSLDTLEDNINSQHLIIAREFEDHVKHVYDSVLNDIKGIRTKVNSIGDLLSAPRNLRLVQPTLTSEINVFQNVLKNKVKGPQLRSTRSLVDLDSSSFGPVPVHLHANRKRFRSSLTVNSSRSDRKHAGPIQGYGCCFHGDNKIYSFRTHRSKYLCKANNPVITGETNSSCTTSRSRSLEEEEEDSGCMRGDITDDWRVKVTPYMWDGWNTPGLEKEVKIKYKNRLAKLQEFQFDLLHVHNIHRHRHGCPPLVLSDMLSFDAQLWADKLALMGYPQYSELPDRGENILVVDIEYELTGRQVADTWYREGRYFNYSDPKWQKGSSNFSQMMWKSTQQIGIGITKFPGQNTYVIVAQYYPAGNTNNYGDFWENVPPLKHFESSV